jgi:hypothetical protein
MAKNHFGADRYSDEWLELFARALTESAPTGLEGLVATDPLDRLRRTAVVADALCWNFKAPSSE